MPKLSVIVPSRNDAGYPNRTGFLHQTVDGLLASARGEIEVIVALDGYWPNPPLRDDKRIVVCHHGQPRGLRAGVNAGAALATGEWLMKTDDHCKFAEGFDVQMIADCAPDWIMIPRRYALDGETWTYKAKGPVDYHYFDCPVTNREFFQINGVAWDERRNARANDPQYEIDDTPSFQGSVWFCSKAHFQRIGGMDESLLYGPFASEPQELGFKTWLSGGRVVTNKRTHYGHLYKGRQWGRGFDVARDELKRGHIFSAEYWMFDQWPRATKKMKQLLEKLLPMPTWVDNWEELLRAYQPVYIKV